MPRFVVLEHDHPRGLHWDFMIESGDVLRTWALTSPPDCPDPVAAEALADHRPAYLDYEGPVSGGRGTVRRWDSGIYAVTQDGPDELTLRLTGRRLTGTVRLLRHAGNAWEFTLARSASNG